MRISDWSSDVCSSDLQVAEQIGADDHLAGDDAQIFADRTALDIVGGGAEHIRFPLAAEWGTFWSGCSKGMVKQWQARSRFYGPDSLVLLCSMSTMLFGVENHKTTQLTAAVSFEH